MFEPVIYIIVRRDLNIPIGKFGVQVAHAALRAYVTALTQHPDRANITDKYLDEKQGNDAKIVLGCQDLDELLHIKMLCEESEYPVFMIRDAGLTVFSEPTITCIGVGPVMRSEGTLFKGLRTY